MICYLVLAPDGTVLRRGGASDARDLPKGLGKNRLELIEADDPRRPIAVAPPTYASRRSMAYPSLGDQLDMLWHAMDEGAMPVIEPWYSTVKAVKDQYPKPEAT